MLPEAPPTELQTTEGELTGRVPDVDTNEYAVALRMLSGLEVRR